MCSLMLEVFMDSNLITSSIQTILCTVYKTYDTHKYPREIMRVVRHIEKDEQNVNKNI